jgi:hypothetical protein
LIDLSNVSVLTDSLDAWRVDPRSDTSKIEEPRLLAGVRAVLGEQVKNLIRPPVSEGAPGLSEGASVRLFPQWYRCTRCSMLAEYSSGLFRLEGAAAARYDPSRARILHPGCPKQGKRPPLALPAGFLTICSAGHLDEFPWRWFVHRGPSDCVEQLSLYWRSTQQANALEDLLVVCGCGQKQSMIAAFGPDAASALPACRGRHPHLDDFFDKDPCTERLQTIALGKRVTWFSVMRSVLSVPDEDRSLSALIERLLPKFSDTSSSDDLSHQLRWRLDLRQQLDGFEEAQIWSEILRQRDQIPPEEREQLGQEALKTPEYQTLISRPLPKESGEFEAEELGPLPSLHIQSVVLVHRLRVVEALIGFTRVIPPDELTTHIQGRLGPLTKDRATWIPAFEVRGEGVFLQIDAAALEDWEARSEVRERFEQILISLSPEERIGVLVRGPRLPLLHTLAHLLIREFALECGYNAASLRERVYADCRSEAAGILIYTAAPDADGTLGGLVELGLLERLEPLLQRALARAAICPSDPLCAEHTPSEDGSKYGACCHACGFLPETSCEFNNHFLDRALLIPTLQGEAAAFYPQGSGG